MPAEPKTRPLFLAAGGAVIVLLIAYLLIGHFAGEAPAPDAGAVPPPPSPPPPTFAPAPPAAPTPVVSPQGLILRGVAGSGAIVGFPDGTQRLVPIGRDVMPGLTLVAVRPAEAVLRGGGAEYRLGFTGAESTVAAPAAPAATPQAGWRQDTQHYLLGMAPRRVNGRVSGYTIRPGMNFPALAAAGLRPGDLVLTVNGSEFDQERLMDLAATLSNSTRTVIEFQRDGRVMRATVPHP